MTDLPDVNLNSDSIDGIHWNVLGQVYSPKLMTEDCFAWYATIPIERFVPPHSHANQQEFIHVVRGWLDVTVDGERRRVDQGTTATLPQNVPHGIFNNSGADVRCLFWVRPMAGLDRLFTALHNMARPDEVARVSAGFGVHFLPPQRAADWL